MSRGDSLAGLKIVIDCAHGAAYKIAPQILWELEANVVAMGDRPNGRNINDGCGATDTAALQARVLEEGADIGIALDGDRRLCSHRALDAAALAVWQQAQIPC